MGGGSEQADGEGTADLCGLLVCNIEHGGHLVAVFRVKAAGGKHHVASEIAVDEAETLLLGIAHEEGTVNLDTVHKDEVLVKVAAPNVVLRTQLVVGASPGQHLDERLHAASGGGKLESEFGVDLHVT